MDDNNVYIETDQATARWRWFARRSVLVPLCAIIAVGIGVWVVSNIKSTGDKKQTALDSAISNADAALQNGDYGTSLDSLKAAEKKATSKTDKVKIYNDLSATYASSGKFTEAIDAMNKKHELDPSTIGADAFAMGSYYETLGNNAKAIEQYKLSIEFEKSQSKTVRGSANIESLKARIESLEG